MKWFLSLYVLLVPAVVSADPLSFINGLTYNGQNITCDLPGSQHIRNIGSHLDGSGMCVFSSIEMAALYSGLEQMRGWRDWCAARYPGGGWPEKVDRCLADWFKAKNIKPIPYLNADGLNATQVAQILDLCDKTGRSACSTYGYSPRYGMRIQHMVCFQGLKDKYGVVLDNNFPGENAYEWVTRQELIRRSIYPNRSAWIFVWLHQGPPPSPRNLKGAAK